MMFLLQAYNAILLVRATIGAHALERIKARITWARFKWPVLCGLGGLYAALSHAAAFAVTPTPIPPTETLTPLTIPINAIFTQANNWLQTLSPIASLGIGVMIAVAVFAFLSKAIQSAFQ